jgi:hypothetical protein
MSSFLAWVKQSRVLLVVIAALLLVIVGMAIAPPASAMELNAAWRCRQLVLASGAADTVRITPLNGEVMSLPTAYMIWEKHGNEANVRRWFNGTVENNWIGIPQGQSIVIPAPEAQKISTSWYHVLSFYGAAGDTVLYLPMDR